jgi:hypothetical protein
MAVRQRRYPKEEMAKRGEAIFQQEIRPKLTHEKKKDFVAIDIESGAYEIDSNEMTATDRLLDRIPNAQIWMRRVVRGTRVTSVAVQQRRLHD